MLRAGVLLFATPAVIQAKTIHDEWHWAGVGRCRRPDDAATLAVGNGWPCSYFELVINSEAETECKAICSLLPNCRAVDTNGRNSCGLWGDMTSADVNTVATYLQTHRTGLTENFIQSKYLGGSNGKCKTPAFEGKYCFNICKPNYDCYNKDMPAAPEPPTHAPPDVKKAPEEASTSTVQFFLPVGKETMVLKCGSLQLYGTAKGMAGGKQQWFKTFRIVDNEAESLVVDTITMTKPVVADELANGTNISDVVDNTDTEEANTAVTPPAPGPQNLTTIEVSVEGTKKLTTFTMSNDGFEVVATQNKVQPIAHGFSERVVYTHTSGVQFEIVSSTATKLKSLTLQKMFLHLDIRVVGKTERCNEGHLAEILGLAPVSKHTSKMAEASEPKTSVTPPAPDTIPSS